MAAEIAVRLVAGMVAATCLCFPVLAQQPPEKAVAPAAVGAQSAVDIDASEKAFQQQFSETEALIARMQARLKQLDAVSENRTQDLEFLDTKIGEAIKQIGGVPETGAHTADSPGGAPQDATTAELARLAAKKNASADELRKELGAVAKRLSLERQTTEILKTERQSLVTSSSESRERRAAVEREMALLRQQHGNELAERQAHLQRLEEAQISHAQNLDFALAENDKLSRQLAGLQARIDAGEAGQADLRRYQHAFVDKLKDAIGDNPYFRAAEERYVFQSDVLFEQGSEVITDRGVQALRQLAESLRAVATDMPPDLDWIMRIDGHTDREPPQQSRFASNLDLSAARSIAVMTFLIGEGIGANRLAAVAFGGHQPLDSRNDEIAQRRNRRIEFRLTQH